MDIKQNSIKMMFPRGSTLEYVQETMMKNARDNFDFFIDEKDSLGTLRNLPESIIYDTWEMEVRKMVL